MVEYGSFNDTAPQILLDNDDGRLRIKSSKGASYVFIALSAVLVLLTAVSKSINNQNTTRIHKDNMIMLGNTKLSEILMHAYPRRPFITHNHRNVTIPIIGFPGASLALLSNEETDQTLANEHVRHAVEELHISYFDVAPEYGDGTAQSRLGPALKPYRRNVFLAAKTM